MDFKPINKNLALLVGLLFFTNAYSLEKKSERHEICGVKLYEKDRGPVCKEAERFNEGKHKDCGEIYHERTSSICGFKYHNKKTAACGEISRTKYSNAIPNGVHCDRVTKDLLIVPGISTQTYTCFVYNSCEHASHGTYDLPCRHESFGVETYESCPHSSYGVDIWKSCRHESFGVEEYATCEMYKTPEQLEIYISETLNSIDLYLALLPERKSLLLSSLKQRKELWCLGDRYSDNPLYDEVVEDIKDVFFNTFGVPYDESTYDCDLENDPFTEITVVAGSLNCDDYSLSDLRSLQKPEDLSESDFSTFTRQCNLKKSHDSIVDWFDKKVYETDLLIEDIVAKKIPEKAEKLTELKNLLDERQ